MTLNNLSTIVPFGVHGYYVIDSIKQNFLKPLTKLFVPGPYGFCRVWWIAIFGRRCFSRQTPSSQGGGALAS